MRNFVALLLLLWSTLATAQMQRVAVLEFKTAGKEVNEEWVENLTGSARIYVREALPPSEYDVINYENMQRRLRDNGKSISDCKIADCEVDLGEVLGANYIISGSVSLIQEEYIIRLHLHDVDTGQNLGSIELEPMRINDSELLPKFKSAIQSLVGDYIVSSVNRVNAKIVKVKFTFLEQEGLEPEYKKTPRITVTDYSRDCKRDRTDSCEVELPEGIQTVEIHQENYHRYRGVLDLNAKDTHEITLKPRFGMLSLSTTPEQVNIELRHKTDGNFKPITKNSFENEFLENSGTYTATVKDDCFREHGKNITINPGDVRDEELILQYREAGIHVVVFNDQGEPVPAKLYIDDMLFGSSPWQGAIPLCTEELLVKHGRSKKKHRFKRRELNELKIKELDITLD